VLEGMLSLMKTTPRVGWVRGDSVPDKSAAQEILKLKRKIEELEAQIDSAGMSAPAGTESLAQRDETTLLHFRHEDRNQFLDARETISWNGILSALGPAASEQDRKETLVEAFRNRFHEGNGRPIFSCYLRDEDLQRIKLQLCALGIIKEVDGAAGANKRWALTPYGDRLLTQVAAIRSSAKPT
jgi:hypothetical protein